MVRGALGEVSEAREFGEGGVGVLEAELEHLAQGGGKLARIEGFESLLLAGGVLSIRPDHGRVIALVRQYLRQGRWAVVAHPDTPEQVAQAERTLQEGSERVVRTL